MIHRMLFSLEELLQLMEAEKLALGRIKLDISFEEFNMEALVTYDGVPPVLSHIRPSDAELMEEEGALAQLSGFLVRKYARKIKIEEKDGKCQIRLGFEH